jgi:hypothetical protein
MANNNLWPRFQSWGAVTASPSANSIATTLISRIRYGWQKRGCICVLVDKLSGFHYVLTNQLLGCGWGRAGDLSGNGVML